MGGSRVGEQLRVLVRYLDHAAADVEVCANGQERVEGREGSGPAWKLTNASSQIQGAQDLDRQVRVDLADDLDRFAG